MPIYAYDYDEYDYDEYDYVWVWLCSTGLT